MDNFQPCCLFCYKNYEAMSNLISKNNDLNEPFASKNENLLKRFLQMLERYKLGTDKVKHHRKKTKSYLKSLKALVSYGMGACADCFKIVSSFADLFHQMRQIELILNWKLSSLKSIMAAATKVPSRVELFKEAVTLLKLNEIDLPTVEHLMEQRNGFITRSAAMLKDSYPKVSLVRYDEQAESFQSLKVVSQQENESSIQTPKVNSVSKNKYEHRNYNQKRLIKPLRQNLRNRLVKKKVQKSINFLLKKRLIRRKKRNNVAAIKIKLNQNNKSVEKFVPPSVLSISEKLINRHGSDKSSCQNDVSDNLFKFESKTSIKLELDAVTSNVDEISDNCSEVSIDNKNLVSDNCESDDHGHGGDETTTTATSDSDTEGSISGDADAGRSKYNFRKTFNSSPATRKGRPARNTYTCSSCELSFKSITQLKLHGNLVHKNKTDFNCPKCHLTFKNRKTLIHHLSSTHKTVRKPTTAKGNDDDKVSNKLNLKQCRFLCTICNDKTFNYLHDLLLHWKQTSCKRTIKNPSEFVTVKVISTTRRKSTEGATPTPLLLPPYQHCCSLEKLNSYKEIAAIKVSPEIFNCPNSNCLKPFYSKEQLNAHAKLHGSFKCNFCKVVKDYAPEMVMHERIHFTKDCDSWNCTQCKVKFWKKQTYIEHYLKEHMTMTLSFVEMRLCCGICRENRTVNGGRFHLMKHYVNSHDLNQIKENDKCSNSKPLTILNCPVEGCSAYFLRQIVLSRHVKQAHSNLEVNEMLKARGLLCKDCGKKFTLPHYLKQHRQRYHVDKEKIVHCSIRNCNGTFETEEEMKTHLGRSHQKKIIDCKKCHRSFATKLGFSRHEKHHEKLERGEEATEKGQHVCHQCGKIFLLKNDLLRHLLTHSGPESWKFSCSICGKKSPSKWKLDAHMRIHSKEKPYVCEICGVKYAHRHNLRIHVNSKHPGVVQDLPRKYDKRNLTSRKGIKRTKDKDTTRTESDAESKDD